jgi:hypothetical protein
MRKATNGTTNGYQASTMSTKRLDGDAELRKIASAGREWMFKHGRKIDMESKLPFPLTTVGAKLTGSLRLQALSRVGTIDERR